MLKSVVKPNNSNNKFVRAIFDNIEILNFFLCELSLILGVGEKWKNGPRYLHEEPVYRIWTRSIDWFRSRVRKSRYWGGKPFSSPSTAGRNEAFLLVQWRTMYFALRLFVYTVCCRPGCQCLSVLRTRKWDVILTQWATVVGEVTSPSSDTMCHSCAPVA